MHPPGPPGDSAPGLPARLRAAHHPLHQKAVTHRLEFRRYRFPFGRAVRTAHGPWVEREGLLVRLEDEAGWSGYGEVAPIPWFGTETLEEAEEALARLGGAAEAASLEGIDERYGCVRFALASALAEAERVVPCPPASSDPRRVWDPAFARGFGGQVNAPYPGDAGTTRLPVAALLPAGKAALAAADQALESGFVVLKWKVGVLPVTDELVVLDDLLARLPAHVKLRLDANGAWTTRQAATVLERCAARPIEFVEQPCFAQASQGAAQQRRVADSLLGLAKDYPTPIALDESVTGLANLRAWLERGWPGVLVVKPALAGAPADVLALLASHRADVVFSSAFETAVGRQAALQVAFQFTGRQPRALGFGMVPLFRDGRIDGLPAVPFLTPEAVNAINPGAIWNALS
jgi:o-succinylbenzoate synthase